MQKKKKSETLKVYLSDGISNREESVGGKKNIEEVIVAIFQIISKL